jgi:hypothetical protein
MDWVYFLGAKMAAKKTTDKWLISVFFCGKIHRKVAYFHVCFLPRMILVQKRKLIFLYGRFCAECEGNCRKFFLCCKSEGIFLGRMILCENWRKIFNSFFLFQMKRKNISFTFRTWKGWKISITLHTKSSVPKNPLHSEQKDISGKIFFTFHTKSTKKKKSLYICICGS